MDCNALVGEVDENFSKASCFDLAKCGFVDLLQSERKEASFWSWHWLEPDVRGESRQKVSTASFTVGQCFPRFFFTSNPAELVLTRIQALVKEYVAWWRWRRWMRRRRRRWMRSRTRRWMRSRRRRWMRSRTRRWTGLSRPDPPDLHPLLSFHQHTLCQ